MAKRGKNLMPTLRADTSIGKYAKKMWPKGTAMENVRKNAKKI